MVYSVPQWMPKKVKANPTNECINLYEFKTEEALYKAVSDFAYVEYNYVRPHSYNNYATPHEARIASWFFSH